MNYHYEWQKTLEKWLQTLEQTLHMIAPRLLVWACTISIIDFATKGALLEASIFIWGWAIVQGIAVEQTLPELWRQSADAFKTNPRKGVTIGLIAVVTSIVVFFALAVQFKQQATGIPLLAALQSLGVDANALSYIRAGTVVFLTAVLIILSRMNTETKPNETPKEVSDEPNIPEELPNIPEPDPEETKRIPNISELPRIRSIDTNMHPNIPNESEEKRKMREALENNPHIRTGELAALAGVKPPRASEFRKQWLAERQEQAV